MYSYCRILIAVVGFAIAQPGLASELTNQIPESKKVADFSVFPEAIALDGPFSYRQLLVTATLESGEAIDLTRQFTVDGASDFVDVTKRGLVSPKADGKGELVLKVLDQVIQVPVEVQNSQADVQVDFIRDVTPAMSKMGCNQGTCHGAKDGKNGFKLSLRGYDPQYDHRALVDDISGRRFNRAVPEQSLMLLKASGEVPHVGGQLTQPGERHYEILKNWIAGGVQLKLDAHRVTHIEIFPQNPTLPLPNMTQQFAILAHLSDGSVQDVSDDAFISSGDIEIATADGNGVLTLLRRGEAPVLARYDGAYAATTVTVMGDRSEFEWKKQPQFNYIDKLVDDKLQRVKVQSSGLASDEEFVRRIYLDLTGLPPTAEQAKHFLDDETDSQTKRNQLVDELIGSGPFVEYWTNKWCDLLQVNEKFLGKQGVHAFRNWIKQSVASNKPYDQMVREILTASGSTLDHPASAYYKVLRTPEDTMENTTQLFLAVRFNCNKCHDHPFERWTQNQYYNLSAYFAQVGRKEDKRFAGQRLGGSAVEGAKPLVEVIYDTGSGDVKHLLTGQVVQPEFPYQNDLPSEASSRREALAIWMTSPDNQYFASSYVNRLWGYLLGRGIIEPIDDIRAGNPPTNPELLQALTHSFVQSNFDMRHILREICKSRVYQQSIRSNRWNADDHINFSHATPRRLPAEVLFDAIHRATGSEYHLPNLPIGFRASQLPGTDAKIPFLDDFGRPSRESACECERATGVMLGPVMKLVNGPTISNAIADGSNELARLEASITDDRQLIEELFLRFLSRRPKEKEFELGTKLLNEPIEEIKIARDALQQREQQMLSEMPEWEESHRRVVEWNAIELAQGKSDAGAKFETKEDRTILVTGPLSKDIYHLEFDLSPGTYTGVRLEALTDDSIPSKGPGRAKNGNFVLNELEVRITNSDGKSGEAITLRPVAATFSQDNYDFANAVDGNRGTGWAISPETGKSQTAYYQFDEPAEVPEGAKLSITMVQQYQDSTHALGKFRVGLTSSPLPLRLENELPVEIRELVQKPLDLRLPEEIEQLTDYFLEHDDDRQQKQADLEQAIELDENRRLTALQDLAWALINSPAFLFNR